MMKQLKIITLMKKHLIKGESPLEFHMQDLKNMKVVDDKIKFDKIMTLSFSIIGSFVGAFCVIFFTIKLFG